MIKENEHSGSKQLQKPYVEWDESVIIPSRKTRHQKSNKKQQEEPKQPKFSKLEQSKMNSPIHPVKYVRSMRFLRSVKRICVRIFLCFAILFVVFWWKFVFVYDLPPYIQQQFPQTTAFIAWKTWSFGPPVMNLKSYGNPANQIDLNRYLIRMDSYKDIVIHPIIIWSFKEH